MSTADERPLPRSHALPYGASRMRAHVQILGGIVLGIGLASAVGLNPGLLFAAYASGLGVLLLCIGLLLPEDPETDRRGQP
ncbi:MAG: uncharacterized protein JWP40_3755 [Blastococcus sp.]|jgi:hypothetical protein|nr:uncharacterized protein [Blastococcus sp.]